MKLTIDTDGQQLTCEDAGSQRSLPLYSREAFEMLSLQWVRVGWSLRYYHNFSWFGQPVLQLPEDLVRLQEVVYRVRPQVIIETGVYYAGSLLFHATLLAALGGGRVIGIDREIRAGVREAVREHILGARISMVEGNSVDAAVVAAVAGKIRPGETTLVILDSCHTREHVNRELESYAPLVSTGSYLIATDGIMRELADVPRGEAGWRADNPLAAATEFAARHPEFVQEQPPWLFHDGELTENVTYWPGAWLRKIR